MSHSPAFEEAPEPAAPSPAASLPGRERWLDAWRGLAVALLLLDHLLAAAEVWHLGEGRWGLVGSVLRLTLTRASLPVFMVVSGVCLARRLPSRRRLVQVAGAAVVVNLLAAAAPIGIHPLEILAVWLGCAVVARWWVPHPVLAAGAGFIQATVWPLPGVGYQPGWVLLLLCIGVLGAQADRVPGWPLAPGARLSRALGALGRAPLRCYVGETVLITMVVSVALHLGWHP